MLLIRIHYTLNPWTHSLSEVRKHDTTIINIKIFQRETYQVHLVYFIELYIGNV